MVRSDEALGSDDRLCHECFVIRISAKGSWLSRVHYRPYLKGKVKRPTLRFIFQHVIH